MQYVKLMELRGKTTPALVNPTMELANLNISSYPKRNINGKLICNVTGCRKHQRLHQRSGMYFCNHHWKVVRDHLSPQDAPLEVHQTPCSIEGCYSNATLCTGNQNPEQNHDQDLCRYHVECWHRAAEQVLNADGQAQCHAKYCGRTNDLILGHLRLWCSEHHQAISQLRQRITHHHTLDSFQARMEEACFTVQVDEGHIKCINYISAHLTQKSNMTLSNTCNIIDCYNEGVLDQQGERWCTTHLHLSPCEHDDPEIAEEMVQPIS